MEEVKLAMRVNELWILVYTVGVVTASFLLRRWRQSWYPWWQRAALVLLFFGLGHLIQSGTSLRGFPSLTDPLSLILGSGAYGGQYYTALSSQLRPNTLEEMRAVNTLANDLGRQHFLLVLVSLAALSASWQILGRGRHQMVYGDEPEGAEGEPSLR